jgi:hypothetical protein
LTELGLVIVGPVASQLTLDIADDIPILRVRAEPITPLEEDLEAMVGYAASSTFEGPDEDRWRVLTEASLQGNAEMLWACAQVQGAAIAQAASQWERILILSWFDEPGVGPVARQLASLKRPITVLIGGEISSGAEVRRNQVILADLLRTQSIAAVVYNASPARVLDVVIESARSPAPLDIARARPLDLGPLLDLPPTWCLPAPPVQFFRLVHVPMGYADGLAELAVTVAIRRALYDLMSGPPVDIAGESRSLTATEAREMLPQGSVQAITQDRVRDALDLVVFQGQELLVEQIDSVLQPLLEEISDIARAVVELERMRLHHLRQYTAVGIHFTCDNLSARMDAVQELYPSHLLDDLDVLLTGRAPAAEDGSFHIHAWRNTFAGLHSFIAKRNVPGASVAVGLVRERFELFKSEYSAAMGRVLGALVERSRDPAAPPSSRELRFLQGRAQAVRGALEEALEGLDERIDLGCEAAVKADRLVRWAAPTATELRERLNTRIQSLPCAVEVLRGATDALARRRLGMVETRDFEHLLAELRSSVSALGTSVEHWPSYEACLMVLLDGLDPPVLRQSLSQYEGAEVELHLQRPVEPALMNWLTASGMLVVVAPRLQTCALYWQRAEALTVASAEGGRSAKTEHHLADLVLPPPEGDSAATLVGMIRAACFVLVGLIVGELKLVRHESLSVHGVVAVSQDLPAGVLLPHGALHLFAHDPERLARLGSRLEERIVALPYTADGADTVGKLIEMASLGPSPALAAQIGMDGPRFEHLKHPVLALLGAHANLAIAAMVDCLHTQELQTLTLPREHRALLDVQQLSPSGS